MLLDTHTFLWWVTDDPRISPRVAAIIRDGRNELFLSAASAWEIAIKAKIGRLRLPDVSEGFIGQQMVANRITPLPVQIRHALRVFHLPDHHHDPFDRILVAQCQMEGLPILTANPRIARYDVAVIW